MGTPWGGGSAARIRREFQARIDGGQVFLCPFCGREILPGMLWDVDHATPRDVDPSATWDPGNTRPAHRRCNRRAGQRATTRKRYGRRRLVIVAGGPRTRPKAPEPSVGRSDAPVASCAVCTTGRAVANGLCSACASPTTAQL